MEYTAYLALPCFQFSCQQYPQLLRFFFFALFFPLSREMLLVQILVPYILSIKFTKYPYSTLSSNGHCRNLEFQLAKQVVLIISLIYFMNACNKKYCLKVSLAQATEETKDNLTIYIQSSLYPRNKIVCRQPVMENMHTVSEENILLLSVLDCLKEIA